MSKKTSLNWRALYQRSYRIARALAHTSLPEILLLSTLILSRYLANIDFSYPSEVVAPIVLFSIVATVVFYTYKLILGRTFTAHLASVPFVYLLYSFRYHMDANDDLVRAVLPNQWETTFTRSLVYALALGAICGALAWLLARIISSSKQLQSLQLGKVLVFVIGFLFLTQAFKVTMRLVQIGDELLYQYKTTTPSQDKAKITGKPDIYYIVFDRYGNGKTLQDVYGYDNGELYSFLDEQGFANREDAYANYPFTMSSLTSTLSLGYHAELGSKFGDSGFQTAFPYRTIFNDMPVGQILKQNGYTTNQVSSWWDFTRLVQADANPTKGFNLNIFGWRIWLSDLERDIVYKSFLSPFLQKGLSIGSQPLIKYERDYNPRQNFELQMEELKGIASRTDKSTPQFTFAHVLVPHPPYIFNADGSESTYDRERTDTGVDEKVKYTDQVTYLNTRIKDLIATIRRESPEAVVIVQADEGPYPKEFRHELTPTNYYDPATLDLALMQQKFGILASYYLPGVDEQTVRQNITAPVNPFRFVLSHYLGYDLPPLPDCNFSTGNKFVVYRFEDVAARLKGQPSPDECAQYR